MRCGVTRRHDCRPTPRGQAVFFLLTAALIAGLVAGCAGVFKDVPVVVQCPATIETPVLYAGDTWTVRFNNNSRWRQTYDTVTEDGLLRGQGRVPNAVYYFDQAHTLKKVYFGGKWITQATIDFPDIGQVELDFPLTVGKRWTSTWYRYAFSPTLQDSDVAGCEQIKVPAGTFLAVRIEVRRRDAMSTSASFQPFTLWYAPAVKYWVKGSGGSSTISDPYLEFVLESYTITTPTPKTP